VAVNSTVVVLAQSVETVLIAVARSVMPTGNSFWVYYLNHTEPTFLEEAGNGQQAQRDNSLKYVKNWRNALDIGANVGEWTRPLAKKFEKVISFEPNPNFRDCFEKNINEDNVILHPYGLSTHSHTAEQGTNATHLNFVVGDTEPRDGDIECRSLDSFNLTEVDYIKIDVDGFEVPVLTGASDTLRANSPVINIEMKDRKRPKIVQKARQILAGYGYDCVSRVRSDEVWIKRRKRK
jgi:FkbM family methyltransferase